MVVMSDMQANIGLFFRAEQRILQCLTSYQQLRRRGLASVTRCCRAGFLQTVGWTLLLLDKVPTANAFYPALLLVEIEMLLPCLRC